MTKRQREIIDNHHRICNSLLKGLYECYKTPSTEKVQAYHKTQEKIKSYFPHLYDTTTTNTIIDEGIISYNDSYFTYVLHSVRYSTDGNLVTQTLYITKTRVVMVTEYPNTYFIDYFENLYNSFHYIDSTTLSRTDES